MASGTTTTRRSAGEGQRQAAIGVLRPSGDGVHALVLDGSRVVMAEHGNRASLASLIEQMSERGVGIWIGVLPAAQTVSKTIECPQGSAEEMNEALGLLAEAELPIRIEPHRRAWGFAGAMRGLGGVGESEASVPGLVTGWLPSAWDDEWAAQIESLVASIQSRAKANTGDGVRWVSASFGLLGLLGHSGGIAAAIDADGRGLSVVAYGTHDAVCRSERLTPAMDGGMRLGQACSLAASHLGRSAVSFANGTSDHGGKIALDESSLHDVRERLTVSTSAGPSSITEAWLAGFGACVGAAMLASQRLAGDANDAMLGMRMWPPTIEESVLNKGITWLTAPRNAVALIVVGLLVLLFGPFAAARVEQTVLERRASELEDVLASATGSGQESATNPTTTADAETDTPDKTDAEDNSADDETDESASDSDDANDSASEGASDEDAGDDGSDDDSSDDTDGASNDEDAEAGEVPAAETTPELVPVSEPIKAALAAWSDVESVDRQVALYQSVRQSRWPMLKLIADASAALPVGADLDSIQLTVGSPVSFRGVAESQELVNKFIETLNESGVFRGSIITRSQRSADGDPDRPVEFQASAEVASAYAEPRGIEHDYGQTPLAVVLYGERAREFLTSSSDDAQCGVRIGQATSSAQAPVPTATPAAEASTDAAVATEEASEPDEDRPDRRERFQRAGDDEDAVELVPSPLTDEQIKALTRPQLMNELVNRRKAESRSDTSEADKARLGTELDLIRQLLEDRRGS